MPQQVEINLRIPQVKEPIKEVTGWPINNADVRFIKLIDVDAIPKTGTVLSLSTGTEIFEGTVTKTSWSDDKNMFVVYCQYAKRSIPQESYLSLINDPDWVMRPLLQ